MRAPQDTHRAGPAEPNGCNTLHRPQRMYCGDRGGGGAKPRSPGGMKPRSFVMSAAVLLCSCGAQMTSGVASPSATIGLPAAAQPPMPPATLTESQPCEFKYAVTRADRPPDRQIT